MAVYYVDKENGNDLWAGTLADPTPSGAPVNGPWKSPRMAGGRAAAGDTVYLRSAATAPFRWDAPTQPALAPAAGTTFIAGHITKSIDLTQGAGLPTGQYNFDFESWDSDSAPSGWTKSDTVGSYSRTAGESGGNAILFNKAVGSISCLTKIYLKKSTQYTITFRVYATTALNDISFVLKNAGSGTRYLQADGVTWNTTGSTLIYNIGAGDIGKWFTYSFTFTSDTYQVPYSLLISGVGTSGTIAYDSITITPTAPTTFAWTNATGSTYSVPIDFVASITALAKCTTTQWAATGLPALLRVHKDMATPTTPSAGKWGFASNTLYYTLAAGETLADIHFEGVAANDGPTVSVASTNNVTLSNMFVNGGVLGVSSSGTTDTLLVNNTISQNSESSPFEQAGVMATFTGCTAIGSSTADGFTCTGTASITVINSKAYNNYDDGINTNTTGTVRLYNNVLYNNSEKDATSSGIEIQGDGNSYCYNNTMYNNRKGYQLAGGSGNHYAKNNIAYNNIDGGFNVSIVPALLVADKNLSFGNSWDGVNFTDANLIVSDPLFVSAATGNFHLRKGSPAINAGVDVGLTTDAAGRAIKGLPDIGAYEYVAPRRGGMSLDIGISI